MDFSSLDARVHAGENVPIREFWEQYFVVLDTNERPLMDPAGQKVQQVSEYRMSETLTRAMTGFAGDNDRKLFIFLMTVVSVVCRKCSFNRLVFLGSPNYRPSANRFNNEIYLVHTIDDEISFKQLLAEFSENYRQVLANSHYPVSDLLRERIADPSKRIMDLYITLENLQEGVSAMAGDHFLECYFLRNGHVIELKMKSSNSGITIGYLDSFFESIERVVTCVLSDIFTRVRDISTGSFEEQSAIINKLPSPVLFPAKTINRIFEEMAERHRDRIALTFGEVHLTYAELNGRANQLGRYLGTKGVGPDVLVAILMDPGPEMIVTILAILKAGGAYLPIDTAYPESRIGGLIIDSQTKLLLCDQPAGVGLRERIKDVEIFFVMDMEDEIAENPVDNLQESHTAHNLAYVIYTSGSTGKPKGAMIDHRNVVRLLLNDHFQFSFSERDVWTIFHRYGFDFSVWEMYGALLYGGRLVLLPSEVTRNPDRVVEIISAEKVTVFNQTPTAFNNFIHTALTREQLGLSLRYVIFGGEALHPVMLKDWYRKYPEVRLVNMYGITETTVHVTYKEIGPEEIFSNSSSIGHPIPTLRVFVVDDIGNAVPVNVPGELWITGEGVCRGYLNNESLTSERFVMDDRISDEPIYQSGDLARINSFGELEYIGRLDGQVKIRGHRIELHEIERGVSDIAGIRTNLVVVSQDEDGGKFICCYYNADREYNTDELRELLQARLPEYMIPRFFVAIEVFPVTDNGKIDMSALPAARLKFKEVVAAGTVTEETLLQIWRQSIGSGHFGVTQTFFEIGGDSIKVLKLLYKINETFTTDIDLGVFYSNPTVRALAQQIDRYAGTVREQESDPGEVIAQIDRLRAEFFAAVPGSGSYVEDVYPMTDIQLGMVYNNLRSEETKTVYSDHKLHSLNIVDFRANIFRESLLHVVNGNEILRTAYNLNDFDMPLQILYKQIVPEYAHFDLRDRTEDEKIAFLQKEIAVNREANFDFSRPGLFKVKTFICGPETVIAVLHIHHSITDGWSYANFWKELNEAYRSGSAGTKPEKKVTKYRQRDHVAAELRRKQQKSMIVFWRGELTDAAEVRPFPYKQYPEKRGSRKYETFKELGDYKRVKDLTDELGISVKSLYFAAYLYLVYRLSGEPHVLVGLTTTTRPAGEESHRLLGCFLNVVPVNYTFDTNDTVADLLKAVHRKLVDLSQYDKLSLFEIEKLLGRRDRGWSLISNFFTYNDFAILDEERAAYLSPSANPFFERVRKLTTEHSDMPFQFTVNKGNRRLRYILQASEQYIDESAGGNAGLLYDAIVEAFLSDKGGLLSGIDILSSKERELVLRTFNDTAQDFHFSGTFIEAFEQQVHRRPDKMAIADDQEKLSYRAIDDKACLLARWLVQNGCTRQDVVGVRLDRSPGLVVALLAILKVRAVYLPIIPSLPEERERFMVRNSNCSLMLTTDRTREITGVKMLHPDDCPMEIPDEFRPSAGVEADPEELAYIIYTSGTTGRPKGVGISHRSLLNRLLWMRDHFEVTPEDRILFKTPISFDVSIWELFLWMITGSELYLLPPNGEGIPEEIAYAIGAYDISMLHFVPSMLQIFLDYLDEHPEVLPMDSVRVILSSGEPLMQPMVERVYKKMPHVLVSNLYGPTEATIDVSYYDCPSHSSDRPIPIGKPISNIRLLILDKDLRLQPIGAPGELYILGEGLSKGYINNEQFTMDRFISCPYFEGAPMYKTGDLCRWLPDGNIRYIGRNDSQFKIRGFRIEADEILHHVKKIPGITDALIHLSDAGGTGEKSIVLYYIADKEMENTTMRTFLRSGLPEYMVPAFFVRISEFPVTMNGKLDRSRLPLPEIFSGPAEVEFPEKDIQKGIAAVWGEVLNISSGRIHLDESFFNLGGHSLNALKVKNKLSSRLNVSVSPKELFENPTIRALERLIENRLVSGAGGLRIPRSGEKAFYHTSYQQKRMYFVQQINPASTAYNMPLLVHIKKRSPGGDSITNAANELIRRHEILRTRYRLLEGELYQEILPWKPISIEQVIVAADRPIVEVVAGHITPFGLNGSDIYRLILFKQVDQHYLFFDIHHIGIDGQGFETLVSDLDKLLKGEGLAAPVLTYKDYCEWLLSEKGQEFVDEQEKFWLKELDGFKAVSSLPYDRPDNRSLSSKGDRMKLEIVAPMEGMKALLGEKKVTMYMLLVTLYGIFLYKYCGKRGNLIGSPISGRISEDLQEVVGLFANTVVIRTDIDEELSLMETLEIVRSKLLMIYDNQGYPFELLVDKVNLKREFGRNPLFDTCLVAKEVKSGSDGQTDAGFEMIELKNNTAKFDLSLICTEHPDHLTINFEYNTGLFDASTIQEFAFSFAGLVAKAVSENNTPIKDL